MKIQTFCKERNIAQIAQIKYKKKISFCEDNSKSSEIL